MIALLAHMIELKKNLRQQLAQVREQHRPLRIGRWIGPPRDGAGDLKGSTGEGRNGEESIPLMNESYRNG